MRFLFILVASLPLNGAVDSASSVHPILAPRCAPCHSGEKPQAGFSVESREAILRAIVPGKPDDSLLIRKGSGTSGNRMPPTGGNLTESQITLLRDWIGEGAPWTDPSAHPPTGWTAPIAPRTPEVPFSSLANPIDKFIAAYLAKHER